MKRLALRLFDRVLAEPYARHVGMTPRSERLVTPADPGGLFDHCACCLKYDPQPCPVLHRTPCDQPDCGQMEESA